MGLKPVVLNMKSIQTSIRFDPDKLELVKKKEKLKSSQKVVDFLIDAYYWKHKFHITTLAEKVPYVAPAIPKTPYENYESEIRNAGSRSELENTGRLLERDNTLTGIDKKTLHSLAQNKAKTLDF